jgi:hypothetical protein
LKHVPARSTRLLAAIALTAVGALSVTAAHASTMSWNWSYSSNSYSGNPSGSGSLTAQSQADGSYLITSLTGTWDQYSITGLLKPKTSFGNDNLLFPSSATTNTNYNSNLLLDFYGLSFSVNRGSQTEQVNLYVSGTAYWSCTSRTIYTCNSRPTGTFSISTTTSSVPEPGSFALFAGALGLLAGLTALQRRRHRSAADAPRV